MFPNIQNVSAIKHFDLFWGALYFAVQKNLAAEGREGLKRFLSK